MKGFEHLTLKPGYLAEIDAIEEKYRIEFDKMNEGLPVPLRLLGIFSPYFGGGQKVKFVTNKNLPRHIYDECVECWYKWNPNHLEY